MLETIRSPQDVKDFRADQLPTWSGDPRSSDPGRLEERRPSRPRPRGRGAHHRPAPGLRSPADRILFDTGHQAYVHKLLTGRLPAFDGLRQRDGLSGDPNRAESEHDVIEDTHARRAWPTPTAGQGLPAAGEPERGVVAVIGDGALTGGMAWEALNKIAGVPDRRVVIVVNDTGRSYKRTIGGLADHLASVRVSQRYEQVTTTSRPRCRIRRWSGRRCSRRCTGSRRASRTSCSRRAFEDLGLKYLGPVDGDDEQAVEHALQRARDSGGAVLVHVITKKGAGYPLAEENDEDCLHRCPAVPRPPRDGAGRGTPWTQIFGDELTAIGARRPKSWRSPPRCCTRPAWPVRERVPGSGVRRRHRRTACGDKRGRPCHGRHAPGGRDLLDLPQPGIRPADDGRGAAQAAGHVGA